MSPTGAADPLAQEAARKEEIDEQVLRAVMAGATSERAIRRMTALSKADVHDAVLKLAASHRLVATSRSRWTMDQWSGYRWAVAGDQQASAVATNVGGVGVRLRGWWVGPSVGDPENPGPSAQPTA